MRHRPKYIELFYCPAFPVPDSPFLFTHPVYNDIDIKSIKESIFRFSKRLELKPFSRFHNPLSLHNYLIQYLVTACRNKKRATVQHPGHSGRSASFDVGTESLHKKKGLTGPFLLPVHFA
jgi:hypothetical protein